jgi:cbb3-type cytochrome oxidase subunit 3
MNDTRAKRARELKVIGWIVLGIILFAMLFSAYRKQ